MATESRERVLAENDRLAGDGMRVLAVARRDFEPSAFDNAPLHALREGGRYFGQGEHSMSPA